MPARSGPTGDPAGATGNKLGQASDAGAPDPAPESLAPETPASTAKKDVQADDAFREQPVPDADKAGVIAAEQAAAAKEKLPQAAADPAAGVAPLKNAALPQGMPKLDSLVSDALDIKPLKAAAEQVADPSVLDQLGKLDKLREAVGQAAGKGS